MKRRRFLGRSVPGRLGPVTVPSGCTIKYATTPDGRRVFFIDLEDLKAAEAEKFLATLATVSRGSVGGPKGRWL